MRTVSPGAPPSGLVTVDFEVTYGGRPIGRVSVEDPLRQLIILHALGRVQEVGLAPLVRIGWGLGFFVPVG